MKTKKALKGRIKTTGTGKLVRNKKGKRHLLTKKTPKRKRQLSRKALVSETLVKTYKSVMPA